MVAIQLTTLLLIFCELSLTHKLSTNNMEGPVEGPSAELKGLNKPGHHDSRLSLKNVDGCFFAPGLG